VLYGLQNTVCVFVYLDFMYLNSVVCILHVHVSMQKNTQAFTYNTDETHALNAKVTYFNL